MMKNNERKIDQFHYPVTFVTVIFALILIYLIVEGILALTRQSIQAYNIGSPVSDNSGSTYTGILLRNESVYTADENGYIHFYGVETDLKKKDDVIYTLDEMGDISSLLHDWSFGQETLTDSSLKKIRRVLNEAMSSFSLSSYSNIYSTKAEIQSAILQALLSDSNGDLLELFDQYNISVARADSGGFLLQWQDGLEGKTSEDLTSEDFILSDMISRQSGDEVKAGDFAYKLASDNSFTLNFLLTDEDKVSLSSHSSLTVRMEDGAEITGTYAVTTTADGQLMGTLTFKKYGANYLEKRIYSFQIIDQTVTGYKIPESAIVKKNYFVIDKDFITVDDSAQKGVMVLRNSNGENVVDFVSCNILEKNKNTDSIVTSDTIAYIIASGLKAGDVIVGNKLNEETGAYDNITMTLGQQIAVEGVYQINNGYCIFKPILRLDDSLESSYVMISSKLRGGLQAYDRIVLNASGVKENEIVVN